MFKPCHFPPENEVNGEAFLLLCDSQIKALVPVIGSQMKLIAKRNRTQAGIQEVVSKRVSSMSHCWFCIMYVVPDIVHKTERGRRAEHQA